MKTPYTRALIEINNEAVIITDMSGIITDVNRHMQRLLGLKRNQLIGKPIKKFFTEPQCVDEMFHQLVQQRKISQCQLTLHTEKNGYITLSCNASCFHDPENTIEGIIMAGHDTTTINFVTEHDALTGLPNRIGLIKHLKEAISNIPNSHTKIAALVLDLDNFKKINLSFDRYTGDKLLNEVAIRLRSLINKNEVISRTGSNENIILLTNMTSKNDIVKRTEEIIEKINGIYVFESKRFYITASIGISVYPDDGKDSELLLGKADAALFNAKKLGGNTYQFVQSAVPNTLNKKIKLEHALHQALKNHGFVLHYQPIFDLKSQKITRLEPLIRWKVSKNKLKYPDEFLPLAEELKLMNPVGEFVINEALTEANKIKNLGIDANMVAINFSASQLNLELLAYLKQKIVEQHIQSNKLYLELTENSLIEVSKTTDFIFDELHKMGIRLSIDDFGIGYSSLRYLKEFSIHNLKIDKLFTAGLPFDPDSVAIVLAILAMAASLNISVTAEGIETQEQLDFLIEHGCAEGQGYYLSRPLPGDKVIDFLKTHS